MHGRQAEDWNEVRIRMDKREREISGQKETREEKEVKVLMEKRLKTIY